MRRRNIIVGCIMIWYEMLSFGYLINNDKIRLYKYIFDCIIWHDIFQTRMIWYDMIWYDMIWYDMIWYDIVLSYVRRSPTMMRVMYEHIITSSNLYSIISWWRWCACIHRSCNRYWYVWYDMIWYDMIWYDMIWYDMI